MFQEAFGVGAPSRLIRLTTMAVSRCTNQPSLLYMKSETGNQYIYTLE